MTESILDQANNGHDNKAKLAQCNSNSTTSISEKQATPKQETKNLVECPLCVVHCPRNSTVICAACGQTVCRDCMKKYITNEINHSRLNISCTMCSRLLAPHMIKKILNDEELYLKYEIFLLRRVIAAEPDARWCPAPDCGYVVIASGCASCPAIACARDGCNTTFCYHCKQEWHPDLTCIAASFKRNGSSNRLNTGACNTILNYIITENSDSSQQHNFPTTSGSNKEQQQSTTTSADEIKECPKCGSSIIKMNDGSCNHMTCSICDTEFCWLCMKEITDLHYFSPSGCTFWGKKPWSRKKKMLWQIGMLVGAPVCIVLIAGVAIPAIVIGIPFWAGRKLRSRLKREPLSRYRKNAIVTGGVLLSLVISPLVSAVALAVGIPILLGYVYGVVPISLCRSGGCGLSATDSLEDIRRAANIKN